MGTLTVITKPTLEPVTLDEAKKALLIENDDEDMKIRGWIKSAARFAQDYTGLLIMTQVVELSFDSWPSNIIPLLTWPLQSIDSIKYDDTASPVAEQTLVLNTDYYSDSITPGGRVITITGWPSTAVRPNPIRIRMTAGYSSQKLVPEDIKDGILVYVAYLERLDCGLRESAKNILWPSRINV